MTSPKKIAIGALLAVVLAGVMLWWQSSHQSIKDAPAIAAAHPVAPTSAVMNAAPTQKVDSVDVMTEQLRARLEKEPNDVNGWVLLGRSYHYLERWDDAKAAFAKARALGYAGDAEPAANDSATSDRDSAHSSADGNAVFNDIGRVGSMPTDDEPVTTAREVKP